MLSSDISYAGNALEALGVVGMFFVGRRKGRAEAQTETITTLESLVKALKDKVEILQGENRDQQVLIEKQSVWIEYLKGMVLSASPQLVPPGTLPDLHGLGRQFPPANPGTGGNR